MAFGAQRSQQMRFAGTRLAMKQQNALLHVKAAARRDRRHQIVEFAACFGVNFGHVDRIGPPQVIFPGDRMLERFAELVRSQRRSKRWFFLGTAFDAHIETNCLQSSTRTKCQTVFL